jgi:hypothetical protein
MSEPKLKPRPLEAVLKDIKKYLPVESKVIGYCITARTDKSCVQIKWGSNRVRSSP